MNSNKYGEIINGQNTYEKIAEILHDANEGRVLIGWSDEDYTHLDILFVNGAKLGNDAIHYGTTNIQRGIKAENLFICIMSHSAYGFNTNDIKSPGYIAEKLNIGGADPLAELINGVIVEFNKDYEK